jgi:hypothetical protein
VAVYLSQHHLLKCLSTFIKSQLTMNVKVYFWTFNAVPQIYVPILRPVPFFFIFCDFIVIENLGEKRGKLCNISPLTLLSFFKIVLFVLCPLHYKNTHTISNFYNKSCFDFGRDFIKFAYFTRTFFTFL